MKCEFCKRSMSDGGPAYPSFITTVCVQCVCAIVDAMRAALDREWQQIEWKDGKPEIDGIPLNEAVYT